MESIIWNILVENIDDSNELLWEKDENKRKKRLLECSKEDEPIIKKGNKEDYAIKEEASTSKVIDSSELSETKEDLEINKEKLQQILENDNKYTNEEIHEKLKTVDPVMAMRLHPNNRRKILR